MPASRAATLIPQMLMSIPHYWEEVKGIRGARQLYSWIYYKYPFVFPLAKFPPSVCVEVTNACNLACRHCWRSIMSRDIGAIEVELFEKILREIGRHRSVTLKIGGTGEVALHPRFRELISMLSPYTFRVLVYTNGSLLRMFPHREILQWNIDTLIVSVDGIDCESYERIRVGGRYQLLREAVGEFYEQRDRWGSQVPQIEIRHVIMPDESLRQLLRFRKDWLGMADTVKFNALTRLAPGTIPRRVTSQCRHIRREFCIEWDGRVRLCGNYPEYFGDLHSASIQEIWRNREYSFVRQCQRDHNFGPIPACVECRPFGGTKRSLSESQRRACSS